MTKAQIARRLGISRATVSKAIASDRPPQYRRIPRGDVVRDVRVEGTRAVETDSGYAGHGAGRAGRPDRFDHVVLGERKTDLGSVSAD